MPQKGLKKDDGVRGRREEISSKFFSFFPDHKSTFIGNRAKIKNCELINYRVWYAERISSSVLSQPRQASVTDNPGTIYSPISCRPSFR